MPDMGITVGDDEINPLLKPHQKAIVKWALKEAARRSSQHSDWARLSSSWSSEAPAEASRWRCLIVAPLGVRGEFMRDACHGSGLPLHFVRSIEECQETGLYITNYESVREKKLDPREFDAVSLDEAACLRGFRRDKTFRQMMAYFEGSGKYRFVATATPVLTTSSNCWPIQHSLMSWMFREPRPSSSRGTQNMQTN